MTPLEAARAGVVREGGTLRSPEAAALASALAARGGEAVRSILFFGSRKSGAADSDIWSAWDLFVVTRGYRDFYAGLRRSGALSRSPTLLAVLNVWLPPNQVSFRAEIEGRAVHAKCAVIDEAALLRETGPRRKDHFCAGRLFQPAEIVYARDAAARAAAETALASARLVTLAWVRPWLGRSFDAAEYGRSLLRVSLAQEIRPEPEGRADALHAAQTDWLGSAFEPLLDAWSEAGALRREGQRYTLARPVTRLERLGLTLFFRWSLLRATLRWAKYVISFEDWLDYIIRKAERHSGARFELSPRERRFPLLFLWPRVFRYLRSKDRRA